MTSLTRPLDDPLDDHDRQSAVERANELLNEAREATQDTEWVVDLPSRRVVRKRVKRRSTG